MKEHIPGFIGLAALGMTLATLVIVLRMGVKPTDVPVIGLGAVLIAIASGFSPSFSQQKGTQQTINAETANTANTDTPKAE